MFRPAFARPFVRTATLVASLLPFSASAELRAIDEQAMGDVTGQAAPMMEMSGQITYDAIVYTDPTGARQVITPGGASTDGAVRTESRTMEGQLFGMPRSGSPLDLISAIFPIRVGQIDTDGDGEADHGAMLFSFQPNVGLGTEFSPLLVKESDDTVNINDQVFVTNQGVLFLNAPLDNTYTIDGTSYQYTHPARLF